MVKKKVTTRKKTSKKSSKKVPKRTSTTQVKAVKQEVHEVERILVENFTALQKVLTNLAIKIDHSTEQMSKLLTLFEDSAKTLAEKDFQIPSGGNSQEHKKVLEKLDHLENQNKLIARGLTLVHETTTKPKENFQKPIPPQNPQNIQTPQNTIKRTTEEHP